MKSKYLDCPPDDVGYEQDCALKIALKRLFNDPSNFKLKDIQLTDKIPIVDPGRVHDVYCGIKLEIELVGEYYFDLNGKLKKG